jgi:type IV pilus assembly protein PilM
MIQNFINNLKIKKEEKEKVIIGIDIGSVYLKSVEVKYLLDKVELVNYIIEPLQLDLASILKKIPRLQEASGLNISMGGPSTIIRYIEFPRMAEEEFRKSLKFEAEKHIPFPIQEVNLDGYILRDNLPDNKMLVVVAAVKKDLLNMRLKLFQDLGLKIQAVDLDPLSIVNAFNFNYVQDEGLKNKALALLNIGAQESSLSIIDNGIPRLSRDIHIAGNTLTQKIAEAMNLEIKKAEEFKNNLNKENINKALEIITPVLSNIASEVRASFDYYESQSASSVEKIFLSGGGASFPGINEVLTTLLGIEINSWDAFKKINLTQAIDTTKLKSVSNLLTVAVGLIVRS